MAALRPNLPILPERMRSLPIDARGFPVPWFVGSVDGVPDFRVVRPGGLAEAYRKKICWLCGQPLGVHLVFVIGPMCVINRVTSEPPCHLECAEFAAKGCPFLTTPSMRRNTHDLPVHAKDPPGEFLRRNPAATALYKTRSFKPFRVDQGYLLRLGEPEEVTWWAQGRPATRSEVEESIAGGMPVLQAAANREGAETVAALANQIRIAEKLLPA